MTNEKKYTLLVKMIREYDEAAKLDGFGEKVIQRPGTFAHSSVSPLPGLRCGAASGRPGGYGQGDDEHGDPGRAETDL